MIFKFRRKLSLNGSVTDKSNIIEFSKLEVGKQAHRSPYYRASGRFPGGGGGTPEVSLQCQELTAHKGSSKKIIPDKNDNRTKSNTPHTGCASVLGLLGRTGNPLLSLPDMYFTSPHQS